MYEYLLFSVQLSYTDKIKVCTAAFDKSHYSLIILKALQNSFTKTLSISNFLFLCTHVHKEYNKSFWLPLRRALVFIGITI